MVGTSVCIAVYIAAMTAANLLVWAFGPWISPLNSFLLIGLDLTLRDVMHERLTRAQLALVIIAGGLITWAANPAAAQIAIASATAFVVAALADWIVYSMLWRHRWLVRANGSNVVGAAIDSLIFPTLAFGVLLPQIIALQFAAKMAGGAIWSFVFVALKRGSLKRG